jgi:hypothetical protein
MHKCISNLSQTRQILLKLLLRQLKVTPILIKTEFLKPAVHERDGAEKLSKGKDELASVDLSRAEPGDSPILGVVHTQHGKLRCASPPLNLGDSDSLGIVSWRPVDCLIRHDQIIFVHALARPPHCAVLSGNTGRCERVDMPVRPLHPAYGP